MRIQQIKNQHATVITRNDGTQVLVSYETPVAAFVPSLGGYYRTDTKYSVTTSKHINQWLDGVKAEPKPPAFFAALLGE